VHCKFARRGNYFDAMAIGNPSLDIAVPEIGYRGGVGLVVWLGFLIGRLVLFPKRIPFCRNFGIV